MEAEKGVYVLHRIGFSGLYTFSGKKGRSRTARGIIYDA